MIINWFSLLDIHNNNWHTRYLDINVFMFEQLKHKLKVCASFSLLINYLNYHLFFYIFISTTHDLARLAKWLLRRWPYSLDLGFRSIYPPFLYFCFFLFELSYHPGFVLLRSICFLTSPLIFSLGEYLNLYVSLNDIGKFQWAVVVWLLGGGWCGGVYL